MKQYLYHDLIIAGNWCNLKCHYCTSVADANAFGEATSASRRGKGAMIDIDGVLSMVDSLASRISAPVLKLSGGELFLLANAVDLIEELSKRYSHVQVLTNGTECSPATVERIARTGNASFNLSLDGHDAAMNANRWSSERIHARVMDAFASMVETTDHMEITAVVSGTNAPRFNEFLDFLATQPCRIVAVPTPVRGVHAMRLFSLAQRKAFAHEIPYLRMLYSNVLAPSAYCHALADFLNSEDSTRSRRCHLVKASIQLFDTGALTPCPVGWTVELGNLKTGDADEALDRVGTHTMYDLLTRERPRVPVCRNCFSQADIVNLYVEGEISDDEISVMPLFSTAPALESLRTLRRTTATSS